MEYYRIKGEPHILANAAWGTDWQWNARWNSKAIPFTHFTDKTRRGRISFTSGVWIGMKRPLKSIWMMNY